MPSDPFTLFVIGDKVITTCHKKEKHGTIIGVDKCGFFKIKFDNSKMEFQIYHPSNLKKEEIINE